MQKTTIENQYYVISKHPINRNDFQAVLNDFHMTFISSSYDENLSHWRNYFSIPKSISAHQRRSACIEIGKYIGINDYKIGIANIMTD